MFDPSAAKKRLDRLWNLEAHYGLERETNPVFLDEIVSDRMQLVSGLQVLRDELQFAPSPGAIDREACAADFTQPSVVTTQAYTNCGDRIHHGETEHYQQVVASRFATISELGTLKPEAFHPTGGGTDDGATLAHVTWAHALDQPLMKRVYEGNPQSFVLCGFDLNTHVGRDVDGSTYGKTRESEWRASRAACGAIVGSLAGFDEKNGVHRRIKRDLGDANFDLLARKGVKVGGSVDVTAVVAAAIVAIQGMLDTARALTKEMDERGLAHLTASIVVNRPRVPHGLIYLARATVFGGELRMQGFGVDASKYGGSMVDERDEKRLCLTYDGATEGSFPVSTEKYDVRKVPVPVDLFA
jgi:hypothetical protein